MLVEPDIEWVRGYQGAATAPADLEAFWAQTLAESGEYPLNARFVRVAERLRLVDVYDVTYAGFGGQEVRAWLRVPAGTDLDAAGDLPAIVTYVGYGGGRGEPEADLLWASAGFAHLHMDTRAQGSGWTRGDTGDTATQGPSISGHMTRGIEDPVNYYYRRLITDAVRAVDVVRGVAAIDNGRIAVQGHSQGGGLALAVSGLRSDLAAVIAQEPFLSDFPRSVRAASQRPYTEITEYLAGHRGAAENVFRTLSYFDVTNLVRSSSAPALVSVSFMDAICLPSTVYAAYNRYAGEKRIIEWEFNGHEGGQMLTTRASLDFLDEVFATR
ncbi:acetylxylan esterase [Mycetocola saprophilus]|uniref:acetylxylan esterase n=1 Tax=Mycetocola saprophilus TaxID=76636 RepID=UPI0004BFD377|nr:acetylxylan esterase [Mycetocola saprophilus]